jgi:energy-coupling factor transport system ATP-binding protein
MDIQIDSVSFTYPSGVSALDGISLEIPSGQALAIIGQNGAGKTTLVKQLIGLLQPTSGTVLVGGWNTREKPVALLAARVGYVFQNPDDQLFKPTVWAEVTFGPKNLGWTPERVKQQADWALETVQLKKSAGQHPYDLSPSQRKKVALAAVLAMDTPIVILDEPTTGQDFPGIELIGRIVEDLKTQGRTVITITHDIEFCAEHFERVVVMTEGKIILDGPAREVLAQVDILARAQVEPPQIVRLAVGLGLNETPLTVEELITLVITPAG